MEFTYDYSELLEELKADIQEFDYQMKDDIYIVRGERVVHTHFITNETVTYVPIIDYYFSEDDMSDEQEKLHKKSVKDVLEEMEKWNF